MQLYVALPSDTTDPSQSRLSNSGLRFECSRHSWVNHNACKYGTTRGRTDMAAWRSDLPHKLTSGYTDSSLQWERAVNNGVGFDGKNPRDLFTICTSTFTLPLRHSSRFDCTPRTNSQRMATSFAIVISLALIPR